MVADVEYGVKQGGRSCAKGKRPSLKILNFDENFKPYHVLFCHNVKICCDLSIFWKSVT